MNKICFTSLRRTVAFVAIALAMVAVVVGIFFWLLSIEPDIYEKNREVGIPENLPAEVGYTFYQAQDICDIYICGNPDFDGKHADLYLTNPESNGNASIRVEVYTIQFLYGEDGSVSGTLPDKLLGKSGFIHSGEYVKTVTLNKTLKKQTPVILKISTYDEETGKSNGFFHVTTFLTPMSDR